MKKTTRIFLVDDHPMLRSGLCALLCKEPGFVIVGEASDGREVVAEIKKSDAEVVLMDVRMPDLNGVDAAREVVAAVPRAKVIALSANADEQMVVKMFRAGAVGYVKKEAAYEELVAAIRTVVNGNIYCSSLAIRRLIQQNNDGMPNASAMDSLSPRERQTLQFIGEGKSTKETAGLMHISIKTAETHRRNIMEKLNAKCIAELVKCAIREGLTEL